MSAPCEPPPPESTLSPRSKRRGDAVCPPQWLGEGESVHLIVRPSAWWIVIELRSIAAVSLFMAIVLGWTATLATWVPWTTLGVWWAAVAIVAVSSVWRWAQWIAKAYILTNRRIVVRGGVLRRYVIEMPVARLQQTAMTQSVVERVTGCGTLSFASAGTGAYDIAWETLSRPQHIQDTVRTVSELP